MSEQAHIEALVGEDLVVVRDAPLTRTIHWGRVVADELERTRLPVTPRGWHDGAIEEFRVACKALRERYFPRGRAVLPETIVAAREPEGACARLIQLAGDSTARLARRIRAGEPVDGELAERMARRVRHSPPEGYGANDAFVVGRGALADLLWSVGVLAHQTVAVMQALGGRRPASRRLRESLAMLAMSSTHLRFACHENGDFETPEAWVRAERGESAVFAMHAEVRLIEHELARLEEIRLPGVTVMFTNRGIQRPSDHDGARADLKTSRPPRTAARSVRDAGG